MKTSLLALRLRQFEANLDTSLETHGVLGGKHQAQERPGDTEFGLLTGSLIGGGLHVAANAVMKRMMRPGSLPQRIGSAVFQKGVRDKAAGRMIHPFIQRASDALLGPEAAHIYHAGLHSTRALRKGVASVAGGGAGSVSDGVKGVITGKRSPMTERILKHLPTTPISRGTKKRDWLGAAAGAGLASALDPLLAGVNLARTGIAHSPMGNKVMKARFLKGVEKGPAKGIGRTLADYVASPSLGIARDAGAEGGSIYRAVKGGGKAT